MLPLALGCVKASFLFFYMRIFSINKRSAIHFLLVGMNILVLSWTIAIFFAEMLQCGTRFWANWSTLTNLDIQCTETTYIALGLAITDFVIDVVIIGIPIPLVGSFLENRILATTSTRLDVVLVHMANEWIDLAIELISHEEAGSDCSFPPWHSVWPYPSRHSTPF